MSERFQPFSKELTPYIFQLFVIYWLYIQMGEVPAFFQGLSVRGRNWSDEIHIPSPTLPKVFQYHFNIQLLVVSLADQKV